MEKLFRLSLLFSAFFMLNACFNEIVEQQRISNSSGTVDAVIAIKETGATVATPTEIYLVKKGEKVKRDPVFRADNVEQLVVIWEGESKLTIHAEKARVFLIVESLEIETNNKKNQPVTIQSIIKNRS